jgi:hypothetical protein
MTLQSIIRIAAFGSPDQALAVMAMLSEELRAEIARVVVTITQQVRVPYAEDGETRCPVCTRLGLPRLRADIICTRTDAESGVISRTHRCRTCLLTFCSVATVAPYTQVQAVQKPEKATRRRRKR